MRVPLRPVERRLVLLAGDAIAVFAATLLALWTWSLTAGFPFDSAFILSHAEWFGAIPLWLAVLIPTREIRVALDLGRTSLWIVQSGVILLVFYFALFFYVGPQRLPRLMAMYLVWDSCWLLFGWRLVAQVALTRARFRRRVLVVGSGPAVTAGVELLRDGAFRDMELVGVATSDTLPASPVPVVGAPAQTEQLVRSVDASDIVVAVDGGVDQDLIQHLLRCQELGVTIVGLPELYERAFRRVPVRRVDPTWLLSSFLDAAHSRSVSPFIKRMFDLILAAALSVVGLALTPLIVFMIVLDSGRPVLYRQTRLGRAGRPFTLTKFRTMRVDSEADGRARWSSPRDPRVTRVGRLLRRTRLDELPNLVSVLRGEMSLVGPRPERPELTELLERQIPLYRVRLSVPPGLTGWAQVSCPYGDSTEDAVVKLEYDLYYIKHQSVAFDARILLRTAGTVFRLGGQ